MKSVFLKIMVFCFLFSFTPLKETLKLPLIVLHYMEHLKEFPDMTWEQFYFMHYTIEIHFDEDYHKDRQLPFKSYDFSHLPLFIVFSLPEMVKTDLYKPAEVRKEINSEYFFFVKDINNKGIFHPPRYSSQTFNIL